MKRLLLALVGMVVFSSSACAADKVGAAVPKDELPQQTMMMCSGPAGMMCPMMDMAPSMVEVMKMQQKIVAGVPAAEKKKMIAAVDKKIAVIEAAMAKMRSMPMPCMMMNQPPCIQPNVPAPAPAPASPPAAK